MATQTTNLGLTKPGLTDKVRISQINGNMDILDNAIGAVGNTSLQAQMTAAQASVSALEDGMAIVANNNTHGAIAEGQFVYVKNHGSLSEGLYVANTAISANGTLSASNLTADSGGGLNTLMDLVQTNYISLLSKNISANSSIEISYTECLQGILVTFGGSVTNRMGLWTIYNVSNAAGYVREIASASQLTVTADTGKITVASTASARITAYILVLDK